MTSAPGAAPVQLLWTYTVGLLAAASNPYCPPVSQFDYMPSSHASYSQLWANVTSCTKSEVHNILDFCQRRTQLLPLVNKYRKFREVWTWAFRDTQAHRQLYSHDVHRNTTGCEVIISTARCEQVVILSSSFSTVSFCQLDSSESHEWIFIKVLEWVDFYMEQSSSFWGRCG